MNNNAAAVLLALAALAEGREVVVSRGELIEIGDGFRIPDVLARSGARLVEVGTTNRTRAADYERAIGPETGAAPARAPVELPCRGLLGAAALAELAEIAHRHELPLVDDLGSGALAPIGDEPTPAESLRAGADLVCFSGTSSSAGRRRGSSSGGRTSSSGSGGTRSSVRSAPTSSRWPRSRGRSRSRSPRRRATGSRCCACSTSRSSGCGLGPSAWRGSWAARSRRPWPRRRWRAPARRAAERGLRGRGGASRSGCGLGDPPVVAVVRDGRTLLDCRTLTDAEVDEVAAAVGARGRDA